jgi:hypothetical protein
MARVTPADLARLEEEAAKAKAAYEAKAARVRRAQQHQRMEHERAILQLLKSLGLTAYDVETLRAPLTALAQQLQAAQAAETFQATGASI